MENISIKQINSDNINNFFELFKSIALSDFERWTKESKDYWFNVDYNLEYWKDNVENKHLPILVAYDGEKMIGFVMLEGINYGVGYLGWIGVLKEYQKQHIGGQLLNAIDQWSRNNGIHKIELETQEPELQYFYEKNGYVLEGIRKNSWQHLDNYMFGKTL